MSETTLAELLASCQTALETAHRSLRIARALADGCRSGLRPPDDVVDAYLACVERDEVQLSDLFARVETFRSRIGAASRP
jgi:hypothetical protein